jgi:glycosyltransferase involved in cell wall biosynthesis
VVLRALYGASTLVWFPTLNEGFGLPVLEAMACGAPVVTGDATSLPEVAGQAALLVKAPSVHENVEAVRALLEDSSLRSSYAALGRDRARQFTWTRTAEQLWSLFDDLVS